MGHIRVVRHADDTAFSGVCPFHGDCLEGLASGPAIAARASTTGDEHGSTGIVGYYLGQLVTNVILMLAPRRVIIGGGVMANAALLGEIRRTAAALLNEYAGHSAAALDEIIVRPGLGGRSGIAGALALAQR
jgi:fructokinase